MRMRMRMRMTITITMTLVDTPSQPIELHIGVAAVHGRAVGVHVREIVRHFRVGHHLVRRFEANFDPELAVLS